MKKFFTTERVVILIVFLILMAALVMYANGKTGVLDKMEDGTDAEEKKEADADAAKPAAEEEKTSSPSGYSVKEVATPKDLLPSDENSQWAALNPSTANKGDMVLPDLLKAGQHIGVDTVGQSLRNANLQLRSDPVITKADAGPWNQSTIEGDFNRVPLELGSKV
tara:strand:- start:1081 stop:1575 length:495 start_codon:yes stop_codon:yes gene_type:complete